MTAAQHLGDVLTVIVPNYNRDGRLLPVDAGLRGPLNSLMIKAPRRVARLWLLPRLRPLDMREVLMRRLRTLR